MNQDLERNRPGKKGFRTPAHVLKQLDNEVIIRACTYELSEWPLGKVDSALTLVRTTKMAVLASVLRRSVVIPSMMKTM